MTCLETFELGIRAGALLLGPSSERLRARALEALRVFPDPPPDLVDALTDGGDDPHATALAFDAWARAVARRATARSQAHLPLLGLGLVCIAGWHLRPR